MNKPRKLITASVTIVTIALALAVLPTAEARRADVSGTWQLMVETQAGTGEPTVTLKQDGENLTGTYKGRFGEAPLKGTIKGNEIMFSFKVSGQGQELEIEYSGTVDGNTMKGKVKLGELGEGTFTGKKQ